MRARLVLAALFVVVALLLLARACVAFDCVDRGGTPTTLSPTQCVGADDTSTRR